MQEDDILWIDVRIRKIFQVIEDNVETWQSIKQEISLLHLDMQQLARARYYPRNENELEHEVTDEEKRFDKAIMAAKFAKDADNYETIHKYLQAIRGIL